MTQDQDRRALLTAFAQYPSPAGLGPVLGSVGALAPVAARPRAQRGRGGQFAPRKAARAFRAVLPSWALAAFTVCLCIPGPFDEIAAILAALVLLVVRFPKARSAWRGGKSHRKAAQS